MSLLNDFALSSELSEQEYRRKVVEVVELLVHLGATDTTDTFESADLISIGEKLRQKLRADEKILYGEEITKQEILERLSEINAEIAQLESILTKNSPRGTF